MLTRFFLVWMVYLGSQECDAYSSLSTSSPQFIHVPISPSSPNNCARHPSLGVGLQSRRRKLEASYWCDCGRLSSYPICDSSCEASCETVLEETCANCESSLGCEPHSSLISCLYTLLPDCNMQFKHCISGWCKPENILVACDSAISINAEWTEDECQVACMSIWDSECNVEAGTYFTDAEDPIACMQKLRPECAFSYSCGTATTTPPPYEESAATVGVIVVGAVAAGGAITFGGWALVKGGVFSSNGGVPSSHSFEDAAFGMVDPGNPAFFDDKVAEAAVELENLRFSRK